MEENLYIFNYYDEVVRSLETVFGVDMTKKYQTLGEIRSNLAAAKKNLNNKKRCPLCYISQQI